MKVREIKNAKTHIPWEPPEKLRFLHVLFVATMLVVIMINKESGVFEWIILSLVLLVSFIYTFVFMYGEAIVQNKSPMQFLVEFLMLGNTTALFMALALNKSEIIKEWPWIPSLLGAFFLLGIANLMFWTKSIWTKSIKKGEADVEKTSSSGKSEGK